MTCHCGNCEDHPDRLQLNPSGVDLPWMKEAPDLKRHIKLLTVVRGNNTFLQVWEGEKHVKEFKSGIGANEMAFFFEDMVIPFRDMFEVLGFSVTEEISIE